MPSLALISLAGGVGRTTLAASLAMLAAGGGAASLAVDWDPQNLLALHFGLQQPPADGLAALAAAGRPWQTSALRRADGAIVLPFGQMDVEQLQDWFETMRRERDWLAGQLALIEHARSSWTFIDTPRAPSLLVEQALLAADAALLVMRPDPAAVALLPQALEIAGERPVLAVLNGFDASRPLQQGVRAALHRHLGARLIPHVVHRDEAVPEAFAHQTSVTDWTPHAQAAHDLHGLFRWLAEQLAPELARAL